MLIDTIRKTIEDQELFSPGDQILIGLSGGGDSVGLFHLLLQLSGEYGYRLAAAHLHHGIRPEADAEMEFVRRLCVDHGVVLHIRHADIPRVCRRRGCSEEVAGRRERYHYFSQLMELHGYSALALGHHGGDQAETILHNLIRGTGLRGLGGIRPVRGRIRRPLLETGPGEIRRWLQQQGLSWVEDPSNLDMRYTRNRIRHQLIPLLEEFNPRLVSGLAGLAPVLQEDEDCLRGLTEDFFRTEVRAWGRMQLNISRNKLLELPPAIRRRTWREAYYRMTGQSLERRYTGELETLAGSGGSTLMLPGRIRCTMGKELVTLSRHSGTVEGFSLLAGGPGEYRIPGDMVLVIREDPVPDRDTLRDNSGLVAWLDAGSVTWPLTIRNRLPGDRYMPLGGTGARDVAAMLAGRGFRGDIRTQMPVVLDAQGRIFWCGGLRVEGSFRIREDSRQALSVRLLSRFECAGSLS